MYVRVARFEGVDTSQVDRWVGEMREQIDAMRRGETPAGIPTESAGPLREHATRVLDLVDRERGLTLSVTFADDEEGMRRVDAALNAMSPGEEGGRRTNVEIFEVVLDESF
jgi:hypothetical protein